MVLIVVLCLLTFLQLSAGELDAFLGEVPIELPIVRDRREVIQNSGAPRKVSISAENILSMVDVPISKLSTDNPDIRQMILDTHNECRKIVIPSAKNMQKMIWSDEAAKTARKYAKTCSLKHSEITQRRITRYYCGENLFMSEFKASWRDVILSFHSEHVDYIYSKGATYKGAVIGHYLQLASAKSFLVGCDVEECPYSRLRYFYVCHYCPGKEKNGNPYKEGPPCGDCPDSCDNGLCTNYCMQGDLFADCKNYKNDCGTDKSVQEDCGETCFCSK
ncbi:cysteine-rich venom protein-like [Discoglossus pictus]